MSVRPRRLLSIFVVFILAAGSLLVAGRAHADEVEPPRVAVRLEYTREAGAERCPDEEFLRAEAARLIGFDPFRPEAPFYIVARVRRQGPELVASMWLRDPDGVTQWADEFGTIGDCETLVQAIALGIVAGIQLKPALIPAPVKEKEKDREPERPSWSPPRSAPSSASVPSKPAPAGGREAPAPPERRQFEAELGAAVAFGVAPGVSMGPTLSFKRRWSELVSFGVEGRALAPLVQEVEDLPIAISVLTATGVFCLHHRFLFACGLAEVGAYRFVPEAPITIRQSTQPLFAVAARLGLEWPLSEWLTAHGSLDVIGAVRNAKLDRDSNHVSIPKPTRTVWTPPPVGLAFGLGVATSF